MYQVYINRNVSRMQTNGTKIFLEVYLSINPNLIKIELNFIYRVSTSEHNAPYPVRVHCTWCMYKQN